MVKTMFQCRGAGLNPSGGTRISHASGLGQKNYFSDTVWAVYGTIESIRIAFSCSLLKQ